MKKVLAVLLGALCASSGVLSASAEEPEPATTTDEAATDTAAATDAENATNESQVAKVAPSQLRQNFNSDRTEAWGDIELVGGGQKWEYVKGLFGAGLACEPQRIVLGEPRLGCEPLTNSPDELKDSLVILFRGECSFADKVAFAQDAGAAGVIVGNTGEDLIRMPAGWLKYPNDIAITIPVVIVRQTTALALRKIIMRDTVVHAQIVAKHWTVKGEFPVGPCSDVVPEAAAAEVSVSADGTVASTGAPVLTLGEEGGRIHLETSHDGVDQVDFEYLYGRFGGPRPKPTRELVWADPQDGCAALNNAEEALNKFVLVKRGGCPFTDKGHNVDQAGGAGVIVINNAANIVQMAQGDVKDYHVTVPSVMVSNAAGDQLAKALEDDAPVQVTFQKFDVQANQWDSLNALKTPQKWPVAEAERAQLYEQLLLEHDPSKNARGGHERLAYLEMLYAQATKFWGASI